MELNYKGVGERANLSANLLKRMVFQIATEAAVNFVLDSLPEFKIVFWVVAKLLLLFFCVYLERQFDVSR